MANPRKIIRELKILKNNYTEGIQASLVNDGDYKLVELIITCPPDSYYAGGVFITHLSYPGDYPLNPPTMTFQTPIFHPNIYPYPKKGLVCISILHPPGADPFKNEPASERWNPTLNIESIGLSVLSMLSDPNPDSPADPDAAKMFRDNRKEFAKMAIDCACKSKAEAARKSLMKDQRERYEQARLVDVAKEEAKTNADEVKNEQHEIGEKSKSESESEDKHLKRHSTSVYEDKKIEGVKEDSVWKKPPELAGRGDVAKMLESPASAEAIKKKATEKQLVLADETAKKAKVAEVSPIVPLAEKSAEVMIIKDDGPKKEVGVGKEASIGADVRAARERAVVPLDVRMSRFRELLEEKQISACSTWEKELPKIVFDPRYLPLNSEERKQVFDKYVRERAEEERKEKKQKAKERKDAFKSLMEEALVNGRTSYSDFSREHGKDERYKAIEKSSERESQFNEFQIEVRRKEEKEEKRKQIKKDFKLLLKETEGIDRHAYWGDIKKLIQKDSRYKAVESSTQKEDWFMDYVHGLKDEHRREKEKKKERKEREKSRDRSRSRSRRSHSRWRGARKRSASRSRSRDKKKEKKEKRDRSRDRDVKEKKKKDKDRSRSRSRSRSRERSSKDKKKHKKDKEPREGLKDGEMSENIDGKAEEIRLSEERGRWEDRGKRKEDKTKNGNDHKDEKMDKERVQHQHQEAVNCFSALLTDLIRAPNYSWKEAKKQLKKDSRWEVASNLDKSEIELLFDEHIDKLIAKKKENFRSLLDKCKDIGLDTNFKEVKRQIRDDPRYAMFSSSDRKCEKEFKEWLKDKESGARSNYRQLLQETKIISHKSLQMIKDKEGNHMEEIQEILSKDRRYLVMEPINDDRADILMAYLEELERWGPPPPPTASEPSRRK